MECREYQAHDYEQITRWYKRRALVSPVPGYLPKTGFIVDDIAAGFLYLTDSRLGILDCFISNPTSEQDERDAALNLITKSLLTAAVNLECKAIKADTQSRAIAKRAMNHGFKYVGDFSAFIREL
jgi:hypothetical protein